MTGFQPPFDGGRSRTLRHPPDGRSPMTVARIPLPFGWAGKRSVRTVETEVPKRWRPDGAEANAPGRERGLAIDRERE